MKKLSLFLIPALLVILLSANVLLSENVSGTWLMDVETDMGSGSPTFVLKQDERGQITGTYRGQLGETPVKGSLKGNDILLEFEIQGNLIEYKGTVNGNTMSGKVKLGNFAEGTFKGQRKS